MVKRKFVFIIGVILIVLTLLLPSVQRVQAVGNSFEESNGFTAKAGRSYIHVITYSRTDASIIGDKIRYNVTATNNSRTIYLVSFPNFWYADSYFGVTDYYNHTEENWTTIIGTEFPFGYYNSSTPYTEGAPFNLGNYYFDDLTSFYLFVPRNWAVVNHTIVNQTYTNWPYPTFDYSTPPSPRIKGSWAVWNGTGKDPGNQKLVYTFNRKGLLIRYQTYVNGTDGWLLDYESKLEGWSKVNPFILLTLGLMISEEDFLASPLFLGILIGAVGGGVVITIVYFKKIKE